jgi:hypothetical protein
MGCRSIPVRPFFRAALSNLVSVNLFDHFIRWFTMKFFKYLRNRFHPLHRLRKISLFREFLLPALDRPVPAKVPWLPHRWWVKRITNAVYVLAPEDCEPTVKKIFSKR